MKIFKLDCIELINKLIEKYHLSSSEGLLWIYLNMYFYHYNAKDTPYSREVLLNLLAKNHNFSHYYEKYRPIQKQEYTQLLELILKEYTYKGVEGNITIKAMEETYEGIIHKDLRVKTGSYYTPRAIVKYMTCKSITTYIDKKMKKHNIQLQDYLEGKIEVIPMDYILELLDILDNIKIIDIACGGGVFLREVVHFILDLRFKLNNLIGKTSCQYKLITQMLQQNLYGIDIQPMTVMMCKLFLLMELQEQYNHDYEGTPFNIMAGNALTLEIIEEFDTKFDLVIGNPPYIGEKGNKALFDSIRSHDFGSKYYERNMDYFYFFIYKSYEILKNDGMLSYITTNYFVTADGAKKLRSFLKDNYTLKIIINFNSFNIFAEAKGQHNMIFMASKEEEKKTLTTLMSIKHEKMNQEDLYKALMEEKNTQQIEVSKIPHEELYDHKQQLLIQSHHSQLKILNKIQNVANKSLEDLCHVNQGIVSGGDKLSAPWALKLNRQQDKGKGIFVLSQEEVTALELKDEVKNNYLKKFYKNSHIKRYETLKKEGLYILYINDDNLENIEAIPTLYNHLMKFKELLQQRREVKNGVRKWYALQWPRKTSIFEGEKIVAPQRSLENTFAYVEGSWYASADVYYITPKEKKVSLLYLLGILNSSLMYFWLYYRGKRKGQYLELYATPLKTIPIHYTSNKKIATELQQLVKMRMEGMHDKDNIEKIQGKIDELVFQIYKLTDDEKQEIRNFIEEKI
ncbi:MAG: Eco57I restriction-modification methylase domain-containing protein [Clostridiaceae bacterium]|nr:Eco57I restriction-modification methylase domain-containing protein [Clostridiaceae bacterium]